MALVRIVKTGVAVDPPSIGAVAAANVDVAVAEAKVGDQVLAIPPDNFTAGLCPQGATVPSAGTVRIRLTNPSAAAIDGASLNWTIVLMRGDEGLPWAG